MMTTSGTDAPSLARGLHAGAMGELCRDLDWSTTALGPVERWSPSLRTAAEIVLGSAFPMILLWGPELVQLYNEGYIPFLGAKHPAGLGQPTRECWPELEHITAPIYARVLAGETVAVTDARFPLQRRGPGAPAEDVYITLSYGPARDESGVVTGILVTLFDTTAQVLGRAAEAGRERLEEQLRHAVLATAHVLDQVSDGYFLLDADFRIAAVNQSAERGLGRSRAELIGTTHAELFATPAGAEAERHYRRVAAEGGDAHFVQHHVGATYDLHVEVDVYPAQNGGVAVLWRDISERVQLLVDAEAARAEAETRAATLEAVIDSIPDAVLVENAAGVMLANRAALDQLGVESVDALRAVPVADVLLDVETGAPLPPRATPIGRAFAGERSHGQFLLRALDAAATRPVRAAAAPITAPDGSIVGAVTVLTDLTNLYAAAADRERLLAERDAERTLLRTVLDQLPVAVFIVEAPSGRVLALNDAVARVWGEPRPQTSTVEEYSTEWIGYHLDGRLIASHEWPVARAAIAGETLVDWVGEIERGDGSRARIEVSAAPVLDASGRTVAAVAVATDITARAAAATERERLLQELGVERARLAHVFEHAPAFLAVLRGPDHTFELANEAYGRLVGRRDLIGKPVIEALPEVAGQGFIELLDQVLATGTPFIGHDIPALLARTPGAPPEIRYLELVYQPLVEADGTRSGIIAHGADVTEQFVARREIERLLRESEQARTDAETARVEAEAANRIKGEFLAIMSHELRTPLNAIGGYAELIELGIRGPVTDEQREDLARIQRSQRHLLGLINAVLNYSRAEAGAVHYDFADVSLDVVLATCETLLAPQARTKDIALRFAACDSGLRVRADGEKLQQIIVNLLTNAVKFTAPGGKVTLSCARVVDGAGPATVIVEVTDTGRGIAAGELERVFEPFVQVDTRLTRTDEGIGLGLAISRDLARGMGGELTVASELGSGSTFTLALPAA